MTEEEVHEAVERYDRHEAAALLRQLATDLDEGGTFESVGEEGVAVGVPTEMAVELEVERFEDTHELEVELEWSDADVPDDSESQATFEVYEDKGGQWRWRLRHRNGNIIADSGEGYNSKQGAKKGLESVRGNAPGADISEEG